MVTIKAGRWTKDMKHRTGRKVKAGDIEAGKAITINMRTGKIVAPPVNKPAPKG